MAIFQTYVASLAEAMIARIKEAGITNNVYVMHGPEALDKVPDDFCIITFPPSIRNKGPYQTHDVRVEFVCKDMPNGRADVKRLEGGMVNPYMAMFPLQTERHTLTKPWVRLKGSDKLGHTSWIVQCDCMVNTVDNSLTY